MQDSFKDAAHCLYLPVNVIGVIYLFKGNKKDKRKTCEGFFVSLQMDLYLPSIYKQQEDAG